jgi:hypothetical protein
MTSCPRPAKPRAKVRPTSPLPSTPTRIRGSYAARLSAKWTIGDDGLIADSQGHYDQADWDRQLQGVD